MLARSVVLPCLPVGHVGCVSKTANVFAKQGLIGNAFAKQSLIGKAEKGAITSAAAKSQCGTKAEKVDKSKRQKSKRNKSKGRKG